MNVVLESIGSGLSALGEALDSISSKVISFWENEPVAVTGVVTALLDAAVAFNAPISPDQKTAVIGIFTAIGILVGRSQVSPVAG